MAVCLILLSAFGIYTTKKNFNQCNNGFNATKGNLILNYFPDNRTYHFQAEDEADQRAWMSVLVNCKERALLRAFDASGKAEAGQGNPSLVELQQAVIRCVIRLPGNDQCCDCSAQNGASENPFLELEF